MQKEFRDEPKIVSIMQKLSRDDSGLQQQGTKQVQKCILQVDSNKGGGIARHLHQEEQARVTASFEL